MNIIVRDAHIADIPAIFSIRTSVVQNHLSMAQLAAMGITPETVHAVITAGRSLWVAEVDGVPVAFSMADVEDACVFAMFVLPAFEGHGIGRLLMQRAESVLFEHHDVIWLETAGDIDVRANGFYRALGWRPVDMQDNGDIRYEKHKPASTAA
jgi:GNAT superfamily N-acetyltransferase